MSQSVFYCINTILKESFTKATSTYEVSFLFYTAQHNIAPQKNPKKYLKLLFVVRKLKSNIIRAKEYESDVLLCARYSRAAHIGTYMYLPKTIVKY